MVAQSKHEGSFRGSAGSRLVRAGAVLSTVPAQRFLLALVGALGIGLVSSAAMAEGDPVAGKRVFAKCAICHTAELGKNKIGPSLFNLMGRPAGSVSGFSYSPAMHDLAKIWDAAVLDEYLASP